MSKAINVALVLMGAWLIISPIILFYPMPGMAVSIVFGVIALIIGVVVVKSAEYKPSLNYLGIVVGVGAIIWGIASAVLGMGAGLNEVVSGILIAGLSFVATRFTYAYKNARFYDRGGVEMVDLKDLRIKDGNVLMKANLLQSMPSTIYVRPDEVWKVLTMVSFDLIKGLPAYLLAGYKICKEQEKAAKQDSKK